MYYGYTQDDYVVNDLARRLYAQKHYKEQNDYHDPRVANTIYNNYYWIMSDDTYTKQIFKTDSLDNFVTETIGDKEYYIFDWDKIAIFYTTNPSIYSDIYNAYSDLFGNYLDDALVDVAAEQRAVTTQAEGLIYSTVLTTYPRALTLKMLESLGYSSYYKYAYANYSHIYDTYKDNDTVIDAYKAYKGGTVVFDEDTKKDFANWYLERFELYRESDLDKTCYYEYLQYKVDTFAQAVHDGLIVSDSDITFTGKTQAKNGATEKTTYDKKVVGVVAKDQSEAGYGDDFAVYMNRAAIEAIAGKFMDLNYSTLITPMPSGQKLTNAIKVYYESYEAYDSVKYEDRPKDAYYYNLQSPLVSSIQIWVSLLSTLEKVFLYTGIAMAAFAMLLFYNFMSISINNKRREIGILRAVGARGVDVFKIFYSESAIIAAINFVLATVSLFIVGMVLNNKIAEAIPGLVLLKVGIVEILLVLATALVASILSSILPVTKIARQKPIDAIREK